MVHFRDKNLSLVWSEVRDLGTLPETENKEVKSEKKPFEEWKQKNQDYALQINFIIYARKFQPANASEVDHGQFLRIWISKSLNCTFQLSDSNNHFLEKLYQYIRPAWLPAVLCLNHAPGLSASQLRETEKTNKKVE